MKDMSHVINTLMQACVSVLHTAELGQAGSIICMSVAAVQGHNLNASRHL